MNYEVDGFIVGTVEKKEDPPPWRPFDEVVTEWVRKQTKEMFGGWLRHEVVSYARVRDVPITAVHMFETENYGHYTGGPYV